MAEQINQYSSIVAVTSTGDGIAFGFTGTAVVQ